jgi:hypothetical protein
MSEPLTLCNYRLAQEHIEKLQRDADLLARLTGGRPNTTAVVRAAIEMFSVTAYLEHVRAVELRRAG